MTRLFKFLAVFLVVTGLVYLLVIGLNLSVFKTVFTNQEALAEGSEWVEKTFSLAGLTEYVREHPNQVSLVLLGDDPDQAPLLQFEEETPRSLAGSGHFILLIAYAEAIESGDLSPDQPVLVEELERFRIPGHEPNRHREALRTLQRTGVLQHGEAPLDALVRLMITRTHQPSADYLYFLLGRDRIEDVTRRWLGDRNEAPEPWSAFYVAATLLMPEYAEPIESHVREGFREQVRITAEQIERGTFTVAQLLPDGRKNNVNYSFFEEKSIYRLLPQAHPSDLAKALQQIYNDSEIPNSFTETVLEHMRWPMDNDDLMRDFTDLGAIFDSRIAVSNGIAWGRNTYTGEIVFSTVYFDQLPVGFWMHMSSNLINQDFQLRLKYDPALFERTKSMLQQEPI